jgi:hypothetical protein
VKKLSGISNFTTGEFHLGIGGVHPKAGEVGAETVGVQENIDANGMVQTQVFATY